MDGPIDLKLIKILKHALSKGFVHIDCADSYGTEREVGIAIKESGIPRNKLFVTTKVLDGWADVPKAIDASLERLQLEYVNLYVEHCRCYLVTLNEADALSAICYTIRMSLGPLKESNKVGRAWSW